MNEKRFTIDLKGFIYDNGEIVEDIMELLNSLNDENEQLKSNIQDMQTGTYINAKNIIRELKEENEQLKSEIEELENEIEVLEGKLWNCQNVR